MDGLFHNLYKNGDKGSFGNRFKPHYSFSVFNVSNTVLNHFINFTNVVISCLILLCRIPYLMIVIRIPYITFDDSVFIFPKIL